MTCSIILDCMMLSGAVMACTQSDVLNCIPV